MKIVSNSGWLSPSKSCSIALIRIFAYLAVTNGIDEVRNTHGNSTCKTRIHKFINRDV